MKSQMAITRDFYGRFVISIGDHQPVKVRTLKEVGKALEHYWHEPYHSEKVRACPFCQMPA